MLHHSTANSGSLSCFCCLLSLYWSASPNSTASAASASVSDDDSDTQARSWREDATFWPRDQKHHSIPALIHLFCLQTHSHHHREMILS